MCIEILLMFNYEILKINVRYNITVYYSTCFLGLCIQTVKKTGAYYSVSTACLSVCCQAVP